MSVFWETDFDSVSQIFFHNFSALSVSPQFVRQAFTPTVFLLSLLDPTSFANVPVLDCGFIFTLGTFHPVFPGFSVVAFRIPIAIFPECKLL